MTGKCYFKKIAHCISSLFKQRIFEGLLRISYSENQAYNEENFKPKQRFYVYHQRTNKQ
jgi:hypothetical protein